MPLGYAHLDRVFHMVVNKRDALIQRFHGHARAQVGAIRRLMDF
jgi:hypothetical protein